MTAKLFKSALKERTEEYWKQCPNDLDCYIEELLGRELQHAANNPLPDDTPRLQRLDQPVHTLALTVGESFEPLLQLICVLCPKRIVLILNKMYSGNPGTDHGSELQRLIGRLEYVSELPGDAKPNLQASAIERVVIDADTPTAVFRALRDAFRAPAAQPPEGYLNAVDITGAKKSMVVGAFLYAAHSGLPMTYVDFDEYNKNRGRPYGYSCKIGQIADPYQAFRLQQWERVRQLYRQYNFRDAVGLIEGGSGPSDTGIRQLMAGNLEGDYGPVKLYDPDDREKVDRLLVVLRMYEAWDSGDFHGAKKVAQGLPEQVTPSAISVLGNNWSMIFETGISSWPTAIYSNVALLTIYAFDELKRIERLMQYYQDYRSAFLRAGGLSEVLMAARVVALITDPKVKADFLQALSRGTPSASKMYTALLAPADTAIVLNDLGLRNAPKASVNVKKRMNEWWLKTSHFSETTGWQTFLETRNVLTHRYVAVSEDLAKDALAFATANLEDYIARPLASLELRAAAITWQELCLLLQLDFLPPNLLT